MMSGKLRRHAGLLLIGAAVSAGTVLGQGAGRIGINPEGQVVVQQAIPSQAGFVETRQELNEVLRQYPPTLIQLLRLDPSLLENTEFLAPYPQLTEFIARHPEILRNPSFYVDGIRGPIFRELSPNEVAQDMLQFVAIFSVILTFVGAVIWIIKSVIDHRRWLRLSKVQSEVHSKLLDRFTASQDLLAYIQTPAGRRFLESAPISLDPVSRVNAPVNRILLSIQIGVVLAFGGLGLFYSSRIFDPEVQQPFFVLGVLGLSLGTGFVVSALVAHRLSKSMGLVDTPAQKETTEPPT